MSTFDLNSVDEVITPCCDVEVKTSDIGQKLKCPACGMNLKQRIFLPFLEYLMENGHVENLDFLDIRQTLPVQTVTPAPPHEFSDPKLTPLPRTQGSNSSQGALTVTRNRLNRQHELVFSLVTDTASNSLLSRSQTMRKDSRS